MKSSYLEKLLYFIAVLFIILCFVAIFFTYLLSKKSSYIPEKYIIIGRSEDDFLAKILVDQKLAHDLFLAKLAVKIMKIRGYKIIPGEYELPSHASLQEAIKIFSSGKVVIHKITIPEGFSVLQAMRRIEKNEFLLGKIEKIPEEGSLLPDTYYFKYLTRKQDIIFTAQKAMREFIQKEWPKRSHKCTLKSPKEALILASIVEKETYTEREIIAGVYLKRLKIDMRLQSCPTAIYSHKRGDVLGRNLKYSDLKIQDPYNTYRNKGLPPTPINNPGKASIIAVLHPEETENLFFVFDNISKHIFSRTFEEHKRNIAKIRNLKTSKQ